MPGWHNASLEEQEAGDIRMLGIIQEQHPDRCRLFMQWKRMDWPILVDPLNLLGVEVVPLTFLIDEYGIVRKRRARPSDLQAFMEADHQPPAEQTPKAELASTEALAKAARSGRKEDLLRYADHLALWGEPSRLEEAIGLYKRVLEQGPDHGPAHFRLGAAYRKRYDSPLRRQGDFAAAVRHWGRALEINPNQYIWRRRIQQYGPRLDKPYPFYDWIHRAREEIRERGEDPAPLSVEPGGAEFAQPLKDFKAGSSKVEEPDPQGRIYRDQRGFVNSETVVVPARPEAGSSARVHVVFRPNASMKAHWNNEVEDLVFWVEPPQGWEVDSRLLSVKRPDKIVSQEPRTIEFELQIPEQARSGATVPAYALYYVCEDVDGTCLYRRQDVDIHIPIADKSGE